MFSAPFLVTLLDRVKAVVRRVTRPAAARVLCKARAAALPGDEPMPPVSPVLRGLARSWISARLRAMSILLRRIEAGETPEPAAHGRRGVVAACASGSMRPAASAMAERLPRGFGWMCALGPNVRRDGQAFAAWLSEPAMRARVLAAPEDMARLIGPILNATGEVKPAWLTEVARRPRASRPGGAQIDTISELVDPSSVEPAPRPFRRNGPGPGSGVAPDKNCAGTADARAMPRRSPTPLHAVRIEKRACLKNWIEVDVLERHVHFVTHSKHIARYHVRADPFFVSIGVDTSIRETMLTRWRPLASRVARPGAQQTADRRRPSDAARSTPIPVDQPQRFGGRADRVPVPCHRRPG